MSTARKFHINIHGEVAKCEAQKQCRRRQQGPHFEDVASANLWRQAEAESEVRYDELLQVFDTDKFDLTPELAESYGVSGWTLHKVNPEKYPNPETGEFAKDYLNDEDASQPKKSAASTEVPSLPEPEVELPDGVQEVSDRHGQVLLSFGFDEATDTVKVPPMNPREAPYDRYQIIEASDVLQGNLEESAQSLYESELENGVPEHTARLILDDEDLVISWAMSEMNEPIDKKEFVEARAGWAQSALVAGRVDSRIQIDEPGSAPAGDYATYEYGVPSSYMSEPDEDAESDLPSFASGAKLSGIDKGRWEAYVAERNDVQDLMGLCKETQAYQANPTYAQYTSYNESTGEAYRIIDENTGTKLTLDTMDRGLSQDTATRRYGSVGDMHRYGGYRWDRKEQESIKDYFNGYRGGDSVYSESPFCGYEHRSADDIRRLQCQVSAIASIAKEVEGMDADAQKEIYKAHKYYPNGRHKDVSFEDYMVTSIYAGKKAIDTDSPYPTLSNVVPGDKKFDSLGAYSSKFRGWSSQSNPSIDRDAVKKVTSRTYEGGGGYRHSDGAWRSSYQAAVHGLGSPREEAMLYMHSNIRGRTLSSVAKNSFEQSSAQLNTARDNSDFLMKYVDEDGDTRFAYAPQPEKDGVLDIIHLPKDATMRDQNGFEFPAPYWTKAARAEYMFGGRAFQEGDVEHIIVNDDSTTNSKYTLELF